MENQNHHKVPRKTTLKKSAVEDEAKKETTPCSQGTEKSFGNCLKKLANAVIINRYQWTNTNVEAEVVPAERMPKTTNTKLQPAILRRT
jgi:hypothetical protein